MVVTEKTGESLRRLPIADVLHHLTVSQRIPALGESFTLAPETKEELFAWFEATAQMRGVAATGEKVRAKFAAGAHHNISFVFFRALIERQGDLHTLLSPQRTLALYERLFPGASRVHRLFKSDVLDIIAVPDGVLVNTGEEKIVALCEYSLSENTGHFKEKLEAFQKVRGWYPNLFADRSFLLMVVPEDLSIARLQYTDVEFRKVPYTKQQVREFTDSLLAEIASPKDQRARLVEQARTYVRLKRKGKVTRSWREWARKHEPLIRNMSHNF